MQLNRRLRQKQVQPLDRVLGIVEKNSEAEKRVCFVQIYYM